MKCSGCGIEGKDCSSCLKITNWSIPCGCGHGDHLACTQACELCRQPIGLEFSGTLGEAKMYAGQTPPSYLVKRTLRLARAEAEKAHALRMLELQKIELEFLN